MLTPVPSRGEPLSGVAAYSASLTAAISNEIDLSLIVQRSADVATWTGRPLVPSWTRGPALPRQVLQAARDRRLSLLHVQHEFNLYGGVLQSFLLTGALAVLGGRGIKVVTTLHGVVDPADVDADFLGANALPRAVPLVRAGLAAGYRTLCAASDVVIVHHEHFRQILSEEYKVRSAKIAVVPLGTAARQAVPRRAASPPQVLVLGFLTGYKRPEVVAELAEASALAGVHFRFCVGRNPGNATDAYEQRYQDLARRVGALPGRATWSGYIPDDELEDAFLQARVLILPYTECLSASAVASMALACGTTIVYSSPLAPLFGPGPLQFDLDRFSLEQAIDRALAGTENGAVPFLATWDAVAKATEAVWNDVLSPRSAVTG